MSKTRKTASGPKYHRVETVAEKLDLSPRSVRRLIDNGQLQAVKIGGAVRVSDEELQRLLLASRIV
jgi:excisionase family DNA binding protein